MLCEPLEIVKMPGLTRCNTTVVQSFQQIVKMPVLARCDTTVVQSFNHSNRFVDQGTWCPAFVCNKPPGMLTPTTIAAYAHGHWDMLTRLRLAMPDKIILLNNLNLTDFPPPFDHEYVHLSLFATSSVGVNMTFFYAYPLLQCDWNV